MNRIFSRLISAIFIICLVGGAPVSTANADPTTPDFAVIANPTNVSIPLAGPGAGTGSFSIKIQSFLGFADPVDLNVTVSPATGLTVTPSSTTVSPISPPGQPRPQGAKQEEGRGQERRQVEHLVLEHELADVIAVQGRCEPPDPQDREDERHAEGDWR